MRIVAILNQKGGVGKTTTAVNLGAALVERGQRVLLIDADPQGNLSDHLGVDLARIEESLYDVLLDGVAPAQAIVHTATSGLDVLPSHADLAAAEQELAPEIARETRLRRALATLGADAYDWVLLDCPPSLGLLSLNAMAAAGAVMITLQTEYFALRGLGQLDQIVKMVQEHVNPGLKLLGIVPTMVSPVTNLAREVMDEVRTHYGDRVFQTRIRQNVRLAEAPGHQTHIFAYDPTCPGAADYRALATEVLARTAWVPEFSALFSNLATPPKLQPQDAHTPAATEVTRAPRAPAAVAGQPPASARAPAAPATRAPPAAAPPSSLPSAVAPSAVAPSAVAPSAVAPPSVIPPTSLPSAVAPLPPRFDRSPRIAIPDQPASSAGTSRA